MEPLAAADLHQVGGYRLWARLGTGEIGSSYLGFSPAGQGAVVTLVHPELAADPEFRVRLRPVTAAAHAVSGGYLVPVLAAGLDDDPLWLATLFAASPSLADMVARSGPLAAAVVWQLAAGLAEGLAEIHGYGMAHRGLNPANVLLAANGPLIADFWVSAALEAAVVSPGRAEPSAPSFLSPEQASGGYAGPASDVFALGSLVVFAATGAEPFGDGPPRLVLQRVLHAEPQLAGVPGQLRGLAAACLAKHPAARPSLAQVLAAVRDGAPPGQRSAVSFWPPAVTDVIHSHEEALHAELARLEALGQAEPRSPVQQGQPAGAGTLTATPPRAARRAPARRTRTPRTRTPSSRTPSSRSPSTRTPHARTHSAAPRPAAAQGSGRSRRPLLITAAVSAAVLAAAVAVTVGVVLPKVGAPGASLVASLASPGASIGGVSSVAFSPDGSTLAVGDYDGDIYLWNVPEARLAATLADPGSSGVNAVAFSPDGRTLAAADADGSVDLWNVAARHRTATLTLPALPASATGVASSALWVAFSPNGTTLAASQNTHSVARPSGTTYLWQVATGRMTMTLTDPFTSSSPGDMSVAFSPDGAMLATGEGNGHTYLWDLATQRPVADLSSPSSGTWATNSVAFSPSGTTLADAAGGSSIGLWDVATARRTATLSAPAAGDMDAVAFSHDGTLLAGADADGSTYVWKLRPSPPVQSAVLTDPDGKGVAAAAFSPAGSLLATAGGSSAYLWRLS